MSLEINLNTNNPELNINSINANIKNDDENVEINLKTNSNILKNININKPKIQIGTPEINIGNDYNKAINKPSINNVELIGNKTTEDLGIVGTSMTEIELSTDIANPTEILNFINKSGTYVAKNLGVIGTNGEAVTALAKGHFFIVSNLQEYAKSFGLEIPDDENIIDIDARTPDGIHITYRIIGGRQVQEIVWINSKNINDYVDVTSKISQALRSAINYSYGMQMVGNYVSFVSASNYEIDNADNQYRVITPTNIKYAIKKWGAEYYAAKEKQEALENDLSTLKTEIETILESVVTIDE